MKTIVLWNSVTASGGFPDISVGVDSAMLRHGEPLFVEDADGQSLVCPAVRIGRLGTHIPLRAALSYADAISAVHLLMPADAAEARAAKWGLSDRTFAPGGYMDLPEQQAVLTVASYAIGEKPSAPAGSVVVDTADFAPAISAVSSVCTLRTGDLIVFADKGLSAGPAAPNRYVDADIDGTQSLHLKIK